MRKQAIAALTVTLALAGTSCGDHAFGDLLVRYRLGSGARGCQDLGVQVIRITLQNIERDPRIEEVVCSDARPEVLLRDVPADLYTVVVDGLDLAGNVTFVGERGDVRVAADQVTETPEIALDVRPPGLRLIWTFPGGTMCQLNNVAELRVVLYRDSISRALDLLVPCYDGLTMIEELMPGTYDVRVRAIDATSGDLTFGYDQDGLALAAGGTVQVVANLQACATPPGCSSP